MSEVYVSRCYEYDKNEIKKQLLHSFKELNIDLSKLKKSAKILIKPNILSQKKPEDCITTHPVIVDAVLDILLNTYKDKSFKIVLGESSGTSENGGTMKAFVTSGIKEVADRYGIECRPFEKSDKFTIVTKDEKEEYYLKNLTLPVEIKNSDLIINLPKMKTHVLMDYTGAVKNFYGIIAGNQKIAYHVKAPDKKTFSKILADIYQSVLIQKKSMLTIMDGIWGMEGNGPANGTKKKSGVLLVSENGFALDIVAANIMGYDTLNLAFVKELLSRKINPFPVSQKGIPKLKINFKKPISVIDKVPNFLKKFVTSRFIKDPIIQDSKCKRCLVCVNHCPAKTIHVKSNKRIVIDLKKCVHCFCCHELCPHDAIKLKHRSIFDIFNKRLK